MCTPVNQRPAAAAGTYNNQWIVVDLNAWKPGLSPKAGDGVLTILEQLPGFIKWDDLSAVLGSQGYWPSFNIPYFPSVYKRSGFEAMFKQYGNAYSHEHCPRANIFRRDAPGVKDMAGYQHLMRYNDWQHDPLSLGSPWNAIMSRGDLDSTGPIAFGGIDSKVTDWASARERSTLAMNGMTHSQQAPFSWTGSGLSGSENHFGQPDRFAFEYVTMAPPGGGAQES